ncbi:amidase family protein [Caballeronia sp. GAWG1-1]|uniref:amidase n=1 Tax=Caballeronia sp. GAWG1-1 TaxID=2921742 RepID=UPI0032ED317C
MPNIADLDSLDVSGVQGAFAKGQLTAEALTRRCLARIYALNPSINALIWLDPCALDNAREIDRRRVAGEAPGPLAGVPVVIKDTIDVAGAPTTAGWSLLCGKAGGINLIPLRDAPVVARLRAAGAVLIGKTNVPVLSHSGTNANDSWAGPTRNAVMPDRAPGGSSAGSASAVAASMAVLALGEETGGSIQNPASAQDLVGIKPTLGLVANSGVFPMSSNRDVVGPIARTVRDAACCLDAIAGYASDDVKTLASVGYIPLGGYAAGLHADALMGKRIGLYGPGWRAQPLSEEANELYSRAQHELRIAGAVLVDDPFAGSGFADLRQPTPPSLNFDARGLESIPYDIESYLRHLGPNAALRTFADFSRATASQDPFGAAGLLAALHNLPQFAGALACPSAPPDLSDFIALKAKYLRLFDNVISAHRLDALVFPQMRYELPLLHADDTIKGTTVGEINIAGLPAVTVPAGY